MLAAAFIYHDLSIVANGNVDPGTNEVICITALSYINRCYNPFLPAMRYQNTYMNHHT